MGLKVDASLIEDIDNPPYELLNYALNELDRKREKYDKLYSYYCGKQGILSRMLGTPYSQDKDSHVVVNHAKYFTDMITGMMTGNPITYVPQEGNSIEAITEAFNHMNVMAHDTDLEQQLSIYGVAYELAYLKKLDEKTTEEHIAALDPRHTIVITDDTEDETELIGIYLQPKRKLDGTDNGYLISVYTPINLIQYRTRAGHNLSDSNLMNEATVTPHRWGSEPITEFYNNGQRQGDFEQLIPLIDAYNSLQSDRITDKDEFVDAILLAYGTDIDGELSKGQMLDGLPSDAKIEWLTKSLEEGDVQTLADSIKNDLHEMANVPNMTDKDFAGNISGEAMKYKLFGLLNLISVKSQYLKRGLHRRLQLMQNMMLVKQQDVDITDVRIQLTPNIPVNMTDTISNIKTADGIIPRDITYSWLPDGYEPQKVIELMDEQTAKQVKTQKTALGGNEFNTNVDQDEQEGYRDSRQDGPN